LHEGAAKLKKLYYICCVHRFAAADPSSLDERYPLPIIMLNKSAFVNGFVESIKRKSF